MKKAAKARTHLAAETIEESMDVFPRDEGTFSVTYDFHLLDPGFTIEKFDSDTRIYTCVPRDFPRCRIEATNEQHDELISSMIARAHREQAKLPAFASTITTHVSIHVAPTIPKEEPKIKGLPDNIDPTKPSKNFRDAKSRVDRVHREEWLAGYGNLQQRSTKE